MIEGLHAAFADPTVDAVVTGAPLRVRVGADAKLILDTWKALSDSDFEAAMRSTLSLDW